MEPGFLAYSGGGGLLWGWWSALSKLLALVLGSLVMLISSRVSHGCFTRCDVGKVTSKCSDGTKCIYRTF